MFGDWILAVLAILTAQLAGWAFQKMKGPVVALAQKLAGLRLISAQRLRHLEQVEATLRVHMQATRQLLSDDVLKAGEAHERSKLQK